MGNWAYGLRRNDQTRHGDFTSVRVIMLNGIGQETMGIEEG